MTDEMKVWALLILALVIILAYFGIDYLKESGRRRWK